MLHKTNIIKSYLMLFLLLTLVSQLEAQVKEDSLTLQLESLLVNDSLPGLALVLVDKSGIVYKKQLGYADIEGNRNYSLQTVQPIGSVSKMILAVSLMKAIELGYFQLDTDINSILPFEVANPYEPDHVMTIRELTTHTSGIIDNPEIYPNTYRFHLHMRSYSEGLIEQLASMNYQQRVKDSTMQEFYYNYLAVAGKHYSEGNFVNSVKGRTSVYSNIASALVGYLIEIQSGMTYSEFTSEYIFKPLQMTNSEWFTTGLKISSQARLYHGLDLSFPLYDLLTYPDGGLKTNAMDLSRFLADMIRGVSGRSLLLKAESFQTMFTPQFSREHPPAKIDLANRNKGVFWNLYTNGTIGHDGDDPGVSSFLLFNPATGLGGFFITNKYIRDKTLIYDMLNKSIAEGSSSRYWNVDRR